MHTESDARWTPRRVAGAVHRRARAAASLARRTVRLVAARTVAGARTPAWQARVLTIRGFSRRSVLGLGPAVSLTSYGARIATVHVTIESIARGSVRPRALYLWLDDADIVHSPPRALRRLVRRGVTLALTPDYGPHKKYYPYVLLDPMPSGPLVTADDDIMYPRTWLARLQQASDAEPSVVHCYRARRVLIAGDALAPYIDWPLTGSTAASALNFSTGVSGAIYPNDFLRRLRQLGDAFMEDCPRADDVWLHRSAVEFGFPVHQIIEFDEYEEFPAIPGSQVETLTEENVLGGENDRQIAATYTPENIARLVEFDRAARRS